MVRNLVGPPATAEDFFDREDEQREIWELLEHDHLLLLAPRRVGKTSLLRRIQETAEERGVHAVYLSAAEADDEVRFVDRLLAAVGENDAGARALRQLRKSPVGRFLGRVKGIGVAGFRLELDPAGHEWLAIGETLAETLDHQDDRWLVLVDELPLFVLALLRLDPSAGRARKFLGWFRSVRQRADLGSGPRWMLAGSIGLDTVAARWNLGDTINDLHVFHLGAFSAAAADGLLRELSATHELPLPDEVRSHLIRRVGWLIPYHLQVLFSRLRHLCRENGCTATVAMVDTAFEDLLSPAHKAYFDYWRQRLYEELGTSDADAALALLAAAARDERGASRNVLEQSLPGAPSDSAPRSAKARYLLDVLEGDGYLVSEEGRYRFRSPLLREYWLRRVLP